MPPLAAIERFFERLFERQSARLFRARLQPIQLQRRIERAMESERLATADRTLVPNRFVVHLHPSDLEAFGDMTGSLASELADGALLFARSRRYTLVDRPSVELIGDPSVDRADTRVVARFADPISGSDRREHRPHDGAVDPGARAPTADAARVQLDRDRARSSAIETGHSDTMVFAVPRPTAPAARLRIVAPDGDERICEFDGTGLTIGRSADNDLVLADSRVSRHHARISGRRGTLVYADLSSTNGSRVNGVAVGELVLGVGDRIELGDTVIVVEVAGDVT
ncbi:MAG: FhaA domain-containing protein [Candidatus Limnocylindrales bacterium]